MRILGFAILILVNHMALAAEVSETFSSRARLVAGSATAIWNQALGKVHPTLQLENYKAGYTTPYLMDVGDGSDGAFNLSTYASFSQNGDISGNKIRLDRTEIEVTEFVLEAGWTIEPVVSSSITIRSLSSVKIYGTIDCSGRDGSNGSGATPGQGGSGRCGGANGGAGGALNGNGTDGDDVIGSTVTGGGGGAHRGAATEAGGGGGGGAFNTSNPPGNGLHFSAPFGIAGNSSDDAQFAVAGGGAGGGGGGGSDTNAGGGGGGGGGMVVIHAVGNVEIGQAPGSADGFIKVNGGRGGNTTGNGGPGGGGGGGSVQVFSGGTLSIYNPDGTGAGQALAGAAGTNGVPNLAGQGGLGRNWYTSVVYDVGSTGFYTPSEEAPLIIGDWVRYSRDPQLVESTSFDLGSTLATVTTIATSPAVGAYTLRWAGSSDNFTSDSTGFTTDLSALGNKRYVKFQLSLENGSATAPVMVDAVTLTYSPRQMEEFEFQATGCGRVANGASPTNLVWIFLPLLLLVLLKVKTQGRKAA